MVGRIGPLANVFDFVANAAPGVKEILTVGKVCWEVRESIEGRADWDLVVVDAAATGHVLAQLDAPRTIRELVHTGPIRSQTEWMLEILSDPRAHRAERRDRARGDAGQRDHRSRRARARGDDGPARRGDREPGACPSRSPPRTSRCSPRLGEPPPVDVLRDDRRRPGSTACSTPPASRWRCAAPGSST